MLPPRGNHHHHPANTSTIPVVVRHPPHRLVVLEFSPAPAIDRLCLNDDDDDDDVDQHDVVSSSSHNNNNNHKMDNGECADETTSNHSTHSSSSHYSHYSVFRPSSLFGHHDDQDDNNNHHGGARAGYDDEEEGSSDDEFGLGGVEDFAGEQPHNDHHPPQQSHSHHHRQHRHHRRQHKKKEEDLLLLTAALSPSSQHGTTAATMTTSAASQSQQQQQQLQLLQHYNGNNTNLTSSLHSAATVNTTTTKPHHHQATFVRFASDEKGKLLMNICHFPKYSARDRKHVWYRGRDFKTFLRRAQTKAARTSASSDTSHSASSGGAHQYLQSIEGLRTLCSQKAESIKSQHVTIRHYCHCIAYSPLRGLEPFVAGTTERRKQVIHSILDEQDQWLALGNILTEEERIDALGVHCRTMTKPHRRIAHYLATGDALVVTAARHQHGLGGSGGNGGGGGDDDQPDGDNSFVMDPADCGQLEI
jgi:hypothetical protein